MRPGKVQVGLVNAKGVLIFTFDSDRTQFPRVATWERDRIFMLEHDGAVPTDHPDQRYVVYCEVEPWRVSLRTLDAPKPQKPRRRLSLSNIIPFRANKQ